MVFLILLSLLGLASVVAGAGLLVSGASSVARKARISEFVIGMLIVGVGTSMPELMVSFFGAIEGNGDVAIGNVVGSNIFNVLLILGITMMIKPVKLSKSGLYVDILMCLSISLILYLMCFGFTWNKGGELSRIEGLVMLALFALFMWYSLKTGREQEMEESHQAVAVQPVWKSVIYIAAGLGMLVVGAKLFVDKAMDIANILNISDSFIAITLLAGGTSFPELAVSVTAALKGHNEIALGNIVGSNIFNILFILGICSTITPLQAQGVGPFARAVMIYAVLLLLVWVVLYKRREVPRWQAGLMLVSYAAYIWFIS